MCAAPLRSRATGLGLVPLAIVVHNIEEALTVRSHVPELQRMFADRFGLATTWPSPGHYHVALLFVSVVVLALYLVSRKIRGWGYSLLVVQAVMALNVLVHVTAAAVLGRYVPGLLSAVLVELPTSIIVFGGVRGTGRLSRTQWSLLPILAVLIHGPALLGLFTLLRRL